MPYCALGYGGCTPGHPKSARTGRVAGSGIVLVLRQLPKDIETQVQEFLQSYDGYKLEKHPGSDVEWGFQLIGEPKTRGEIKGTTEVYQPKNRTDYIAATQKFELEDAMVNIEFAPT